jgi:hypothetical protein
MSIQTATLSRLSITSLHFLVDEILIILLSDLGLCKFEFILYYMLFWFFVECDEQLEVFINFWIFVKFDSANVMRVRHIFENTAYQIWTILTFDIFSIAVNMTANLTHERVSSSLQN